MNGSALPDVSGLGLTGEVRPTLGLVLLKTLLINEMIAVPVALVMTAVGGAFWQKLAIATLYSQTIGLTCALTAWSLFHRVGALAGSARRVTVTAQYFFAGAVGAEIARRLRPLILGEAIESSPVFVSWAIGASIALIVGAVLITVGGLRARIISTELQALQARINPHFLFNTLNSIAALIREDPQRAEAMTLQLSSLFRYTLQAQRLGLVRLEEEATIVAGYLAIEQERLGDRLRYTLAIDEALLELRVPPLLLQPLVENAIKHGIAPAVSGGAITVRGWREGGMVHLTVEDTGDGGSQIAGTGEGLDNVRRRLRGTFGRTTSVTLRRADGRTEAHLAFAPGAAS